MKKFRNNPQQDWVFLSEVFSRTQTKRRRWRRDKRRNHVSIRTIVWGENIHEQVNETVRQLYPDGMHHTIAAALNEDSAIAASTATLQEADHGLSEERLAETHRPPGF
jgi:hypothetical protein